MKAVTFSGTQPKQNIQNKIKDKLKVPKQTQDLLQTMDHMLDHVF